MNNKEMLREKQGQRLTKIIKEKYGTYGEKPRTKQFIKDLDDIGHKVSKETVSRIISGHDPIKDRVDSFSKVLGVSTKYLLYETDFRTEEEEEKERQKIKIISDEHKEENYSEWRTAGERRVKTVKMVLSYLLTKGIIVEYKTKEALSIENIEGQYYVIDSRSKLPIDDIQFYSWLFSDLFHVKLSDDKTLHIEEVDIISASGNITLSVPDFMRFVYDISLSIDNVVSHRVQTWIKLYNYNIKEDWDPAEAFIDLPVAEKRKEYKNE